MFIYKGETRTNDEDFVETFELPTVGTDITDWTISFRIGCHDATVTKGNLVSTAGAPASFTVTLPLSTMQGLCPGSYPVGCRYVQDGITTQILVGTLPIAEGNFT